MDEYLGIIKLFGGNFAPRGWRFCNGDLLAISSNTALFSIIGTMYGGDGRTTFALPDLRSRVPVGFGRGPGLSDFSIGETGGNENTYLTTANMPAHSHEAQMFVSSQDATGSTPNPAGVSSIATNGTLIGRDFTPGLNYIDANPDSKLNPRSVLLGATGGNLPVNNLQPYLGANYIICVQGIFPSRG